MNRNLDSSSTGFKPSLSKEWHARNKACARNYWETKFSQFIKIWFFLFSFGIRKTTLLLFVGDPLRTLQNHMCFHNHMAAARLEPSLHEPAESRNLGTSKNLRVGSFSLPIPFTENLCLCDESVLKPALPNWAIRTWLRKGRLPNRVM